jgi:hypothetical protein
MAYETRPGGAGGADRAEPTPATTRREAVATRARADGATVEKRGDGTTVITNKAKPK